MTLMQRLQVLNMKWNTRVATPVLFAIAKAVRRVLYGPVAKGADRRAASRLRLRLGLTLPPMEDEVHATVTIDTAFPVVEFAWYEKSDVPS